MTQAKNVSEFTVIELKALAFDAVCAIEANQRSLNIINEELKKRASETPVEEPKPEAS